MRDRITHASDGTASLERDHPDSLLDGLFDAPCDRCKEYEWAFEIDGELLATHARSNRPRRKTHDA